MMQLTILGCSGGIGSGNRTTSMLIDNDVLIDCGTGLGDLSLEALQQVRHVFLTHSHLDHIAYLPLLVDTVFEQFQREPLQVYALPETIEALKKHVFNWSIWPDFSSLPDPENPALQFVEIRHDETVMVGERQISAIAVNHSVPATGYYVAGKSGAFAFTGDTAANDQFWLALNQFERLDLLISECAYPDDQQALAGVACHYHSAALAKDLCLLKHKPKLRISHLSPGQEKAIMLELQDQIPQWAPQALQRGDRFAL